jgi:glycosyltransferase involved in cell wall biosynthesis
MRYPQVVFFRYPQYKEIDGFIHSNQEKWMCSFHIIGEKEGLNSLFSANYPILVTYGEKYEEYENEVYFVVDPRKISNRWLHFSDISDIDAINHSLNNCYQSIVVKPHDTIRVAFSLFTTCYNSYQKICRAYESIKRQTFLDWEWVILDDSPEDEHFSFLKNVFSKDKRVRLYRRSENSKNIGNVKNEAVSLCRGKYVLEMDHDDEILENCLTDANQIFEMDRDVGFVYMNYTNIYENGSNFSYGDFFALGYAGYYREKIMGGSLSGKWVNVAMTPNINNITLSHIVAVPNHPRIWRKSTLIELGNYCEYLPICDDYELLIRTATKTTTKMARMNKLAYVQYMNNENNNFSLMWNAEISRLGPQYIKPYCYSTYEVDKRMKEMNAYDTNGKISQIWKRGSDYRYRFCNKLINLNYTKEYCILSVKTLMENLGKIRELYKNPKHDFLVLDNIGNPDELCSLLDRLQLDRMKCYVMVDCNCDQLERYFLYLYRTATAYEVIR